MIGGYNHNISYRGAAFHVQTEDSGLKRPQLVTLLYHGGTIVSSQKTLYDDIIKVDNLDQVLEELAKEQHKGMLRRLTKGEFDQRIEDLGIPLAPATAKVSTGESRQKTGKVAVSAAPALTLLEQEKTVKKSVTVATLADQPPQDAPAKEPGLDDLIYAYLTAGQKRL